MVDASSMLLLSFAKPSETLWWWGGSCFDVVASRISARVMGTLDLAPSLMVLLSPPRVAPGSADVYEIYGFLKDGLELWVMDDI
ncbi:hypothetical protein GOP47_0012359 [Adiantum capillus-veneris]|uniref:Uncharacterized protein n=1 Tax=Adiantum capillus-veneris TaxID=13818 RepID=A0A9D4UQI6_ADICA|nr:hypothetical protein GOP47_0012359 [Adiantum capillus-veneris]